MIDLITALLVAGLFWWSRPRRVDDPYASRPLWIIEPDYKLPVAAIGSVLVVIAWAALR